MSSKHFTSRARRLLLGAAAALAFGGVQAQADFPQHPVTFVMTFPAGSGVDVVARTIQELFASAVDQKYEAAHHPAHPSSATHRYVSGIGTGAAS